jgi:DNA-binding NarL/FixJ family response regulator
MRILLADDHRLVREGLRVLLERAGMEIVGEASSGHDVLPLFDQFHPDVLLMDVYMPEMNGIDATRQLIAAAPTAKVIGLSMNGDRRHVLAMFAAGASAYLLKTSASEELVRAVHEVTAGRKYVSPAIANVVIETLHGGPLEMSAPSAARGSKGLTTREQQVLQLVAEGHSSKVIAGRLNVAVATVETHRRQIMDKLSIRSIAELTKYAIREGLTSLQ